MFIFLVIPVFIEQPVDMNITRTEDLILVCTAEGFPLPTIVWLFNGTEVDSNVTTSISMGGYINSVTITISNTTFSDSGDYMCIANSSVYPDVISSDVADVLIQGKTVYVYTTMHRTALCTLQIHHYSHRI